VRLQQASETCGCEVQVGMILVGSMGASSVWCEVSVHAITEAGGKLPSSWNAEVTGRNQRVDIAVDPEVANTVCVEMRWGPVQWSCSRSVCPVDVGSKWSGFDCQERTPCNVMLSRVLTLMPTE
jgi:hypothetical protein